MESAILRRLVLGMGSAVTLAASGFAVGATVTSPDTAGGDPGASGGVPLGSAPTGTDEPGAAVTVPTSTAASLPTTTATAPVVTATGLFDVEVSGFQFLPYQAIVHVGTAVVWTNSDPVDHSIVSDDGHFADSATLHEGDSYTVVFTKPGTYSYHCGFFDNMTATILVEG